MRPLERFFYAYGVFLSKQPLLFWVIPTIITVISAIGCFKFHSQDDIWDIYSPINAISRIEEANMKQFEYPSGNHYYRIQVLVQHKENDINIFKKKHLKEIQSINRLITENLTILSGNKIFIYNELCGVYCNDSNDLLLTYLQAILNAADDRLNLKLTYPIGQALSNQVFLGYSLGFVNVTKNENENEPNVVNSFQLFILHYMVNLNLPSGEELSLDLENKLTHLFNTATKVSKHLKYSLMSKKREMDEQRKITLKSLPYLGITGIVLFLFMIATLITIPLYQSQHIEAVFAILSPLLAIITSFGSLWFIGYPFSNILTVVPFLVLTIGIDDAFLILAGWRQSNCNLSYTERMGETLVKSGASVTVTSITDVLCFSVGIFSNIPVVQDFCLYTSVALAIDFIYQLTFFTAIVAYCAKRQCLVEKEQKLRSMNLKSISAVYDISGSSTPESKKGSIFELFKTKPNTDNYSNVYLTKFVVFLHWKTTKTLIFIFFVAHLIACTYLCTLVTTDFEMENIYLRESSLRNVARTMQKFVLQESFVVNFVIDKTPDFTDPLKRTLFNEMLHELENIPTFSAGKKSTLVWTRDYELLTQFFDEDDQTFWEPATILKNFRVFKLDSKYIKTNIDKNGEQYIENFWWQTSYNNMKSFIEVEEMLIIRRKILSKYSRSFNISSHHPFEKVPTESAASAPINFIQTAISAVIVMSFLVLLFIYDIGAIISVIISILSISGGTVAYLHIWNVHLDAVSLISILLSIGFSVDYSAHICYHYFTHNQTEDHDSPINIQIENQGNNANKKNIFPQQMFTKNNELEKQDKELTTYDKIESTFQAVGWPVIQSGVSTVIGMIPLIFVEAYVVDVFWKTIVLVTVLGMFHALFVLPVMFLLVSDIKKIRKKMMLGNKLKNVPNK